MIRVFVVSSPRWLSFRMHFKGTHMRMLNVGEILLDTPWFDDVPLSALVQDF